MRLTRLRVDATIVDRVRVFAADHQLSLGAAAARLLIAGLGRFTSASQGGHARREALTPEERSAIARRAAQARWQQP